MVYNVLVRVTTGLVIGPRHSFVSSRVRYKLDLATCAYLSQSIFAVSDITHTPRKADTDTCWYIQFGTVRRVHRFCSSWTLSSIILNELQCSKWNALGLSIVARNVVSMFFCLWGKGTSGALLLQWCRSHPARVKKNKNLSLSLYLYIYIYDP